MTSSRVTSEGLLRPILVATDGSVDAEAAIDWAAERANEKDGRLLIITAIRAPSSSELRESAAEFGGSSALSRWQHRVEHRELKALEVLDRAVTRVRMRFPDLVIETEVFVGSPQDALQTRAPQVVLTVMGTRGLGALRSELHGSVASWARRHLDGPLAIIHETHGHAEVAFSQQVGGHNISHVGQVAER